VDGPSSATDNAIARFDLTTGKLIQNSGVTIDDSNNVSGVVQLNATTVAATTGNITTVNATTVDTTNIEVTNLKAKDGTAAGSIADSTGVVTLTTLASTTGNITTVNATTVDTTNLEVTNLKAKDGTAAGSIADSTGVVTLASSVLTTTDINGGTIDGVTIGGASAGAGTFTNLAYTGTLTGGTGVIAIGTNQIYKDASGNVGFGSGTPDGKVDIRTAETATAINSNNNTNTGFVLRYTPNLTLLGNNFNQPLALLTNNTEKMRIDSSGNVGIGTTTPSQKLDVRRAGTAGVIANFTDGTAQSLHMTTGSGYFGFLNPNNGALTFRNSTDTGEYARIDTSGNVGIGTVSPNVANIGGTALTINNSDQAIFEVNRAAARAFYAYINSNGSRIAEFRNLPIFFYTNDVERMVLEPSGSLKVPQVNNDTTANAANVNMQADGYFRRSTSALKYKQDIRNLESIDINLFRPVRYKSKCDADDQSKDHIGIIADEVAAAGIEELVNRGAEGEVEGFQYERLTVVLLKAIQEQQALIQNLTTRLTTLEGN
jgi:hypothetical protein